MLVMCWENVSEWNAATKISEWNDLVLAAKPEELRTLLFTSGSTGAPKCAMLSEAALLREFVRLNFWRPVVFMSFSPFSYSSARLTLYDVIGNGGRLTIWNGNMDTFFEQIRLSNVCGFAAPPRIWNILFAKYKALTHGKEDDETVVEKAKREILQIFGTHCRSVSTGGAITAPAVLEFMHTVFKTERIRVTEGYGISEVGTIATNGVRVFECQVRERACFCRIFKQKNALFKVHLESVPALGYDAARGKGLLWVHTRRGAGMSSGYFHDEKNTSANFKDIFGDGRRWVRPKCSTKVEF